MKTIAVGDIAPDFQAVASTGEAISLHDYRGRNSVVLFFYPKDNTPICTQEACSFRDAYDDFAQFGAIVIGISGDSDESHQSFARDQKLSYPLISDQDGKLRELYGVPNSFFVLPGRVTYVIDREGVVRKLFNSQLFAARHVAEALSAVKELAVENKNI